MAQQTQKKILLAVDGSEYAQNAVRYVGGLGPFHKMDVTLFHVFANIPETYRDLDKDPQFSPAAREVRAWEMQQKKLIQESMDKARQALIRAGIPQSSIKVNIRNKIKGIARDIISEAQNGYNAVVVGRKGMNTFQEIVMGSVASKVVQKMSFLPLLMIGSVPADKKLLVAMDGSENALQAVNFVADTLGGFDFRITLFHAVRGERSMPSSIAGLFLPAESAEDAHKTMDNAFDRAQHRLMDAGFKQDQIVAKVVTGVPSRAGAIVAEARAGNYGTIVIGRRGLTRVQEFFMGRVSTKVIHTIRNRAVWVVT
jgi:nucleotide-binding universal stress UspA family protein